ncbi:SRPBCC family protein [Arthrobacter sp. AL12]|uniref:SRPBCC family protein n=1 Tax=Arthrobacter sp. AL12 TaxID=3042241 RepID=UPI00249CB2C0|nr:SRPBCC family protein [Arthrobacter sp. AL12]MDI3213190.1 SRPBCC family protein [Arthrobacter sp. AL12]
MSRTPASLLLRGPLAALAAAAVAAGYVLAVRPRMLHWGASAQETAAPLPGDELVRTPRMQSTRAVTINAPPASVWPWLVQLGAGRGGLYGYDLRGNAAGPGLHSADRILPEFQQLDVGDAVPLVFRRGRDVGIPVRRVEDGSVLGLGGTMDPRTGQIKPSGGAPAGPRVELGWTFVLQPVNGDGTRLLSRTRYDYSPLPVGLILRPVLEPLQFMLERHMLLGIKSRAEGLRR